MKFGRLFSSIVRWLLFFFIKDKKKLLLQFYIIQSQNLKTRPFTARVTGFQHYIRLPFALMAPHNVQIIFILRDLWIQLYIKNISLIIRSSQSSIKVEANVKQESGIYMWGGGRSVSKFSFDFIQLHVGDWVCSSVTLQMYNGHVGLWLM